MEASSAALRVTVCIVSYRRAAICKRTIDAIFPLLTEEDELLVIEQGGCELVEYCRSYSSDRIRGYQLALPSLVRARNCGIQRARGQVIVFVDDDVEPSPSLIEAHWAAYRDPKVAAVAGRILSPSTKSPIAAVLSEDRWMDTNFEATEPAEVAHARGCNMSMRRTALCQIGGFDTGYRPPFFFREDSDVCFRLRAAGHKVLFVPEAELFHLEASSGGTRASESSNSAVGAEISMYHHHFCHYRDNLYFIVKYFRGIGRCKWIARSYRDYVGVSRWPWRLAAKNLCFLAALGNAFLTKWSTKPPFFDSLPENAQPAPVDVDFGRPRMQLDFPSEAVSAVNASARSYM